MKRLLRSALCLSAVAASGSMLACAGDSGLRTLPNTAPLAVAAIDNGPEDTTVSRLGYTVLGELASVDGSHSSDPDNPLEELSYAWSFEVVPEGSTVTNDSIILPDEDPETEVLESALARFTPDLLGTYRMNLVVTDTKDASSVAAVVVVQAVPPSNLQLELEWNTPRADLDLHLIAPGGNYFGSFASTGGSGDCFSWDPNPDWGNGDNALDNPMLMQDADGEGEGPFRETILLSLPMDTCSADAFAAGECAVEGDYEVWVHYYSDHALALLGPDSAQPAEATVTISVLGQELGGGPLTSPSPLEDGDVWKVGKITWPERDFFPVNLESTHSNEGGPSFNQ